MNVAPIYCRSEIYSFRDLEEFQQADLLLNYDSEECVNGQFVILKTDKKTEVLPLFEFIRFDLAGSPKNPIWDGYYGTSVFSAYFIKLSKDGETAVIAEKYC